MDQTFFNIVAADKKYAKNIQTGDVVIKRPNCQAYSDRDVELKGDLFYRDIHWSMCDDIL